ncbi:MAG TPA: SurA N-terminal domain-containing protein [Desulfohalobiaceae bacterium]|nr:SurA N-terminal domain-containing protein [Desulfohalobiaceae bacterium]
MLDAIRKNAQSWMVKALFAIIVLVFVFWGVGGFQGKEKAILATVNETPIETKDFFNLYEQELQRIRKERPDISQETLQRLDLKKQVFNKMVNNILLLHMAKKIGISVGLNELRQKITKMEVFQGTNKQFDSQRYQSILQANNLTPSQFEGQMQSDLLAQKMHNLLTAPANHGNIRMSKEFFNFLNEKAKIEYILYNWHDYLDQVDLKSKELKKYYQDNKEDFRQPAQMQIKYLLLTPETLSTTAKVNLPAMKEYYKSYQDRFQQKEKVKARHILVKVKKEASKKEVQKARDKISRIKNLLDKGKDFKKLAQEYSDGPSGEQGGDLGWFGHGSMTKPFEKAAFKLKPGQISDPVRTRFGFHLIKVEDKQKQGIKPFSKVKETIKQQILKEKAADKLEDCLDQALGIISSSGDLNKAAEHLRLELKKSGLFSRKSGPKGLDLDQEAKETISSLKTGQITDYPIILDNGYLLVKKTKEIESKIKGFNQIKSVITQKLKEQKAHEAAKQAAQAFLEQNEKEKSQTMSKKTVQTSDPFTRRGFIPGLGVNKDLAQEVFTSKPQKWLQQIYEFKDGYAVARLKKIIPPDDQTWVKQKSRWISNITEKKKQLLFQALLEGIREKANISINAPNVLKYKTT